MESFGLARRSSRHWLFTRTAILPTCIISQWVGIQAFRQLEMLALVVTCFSSSLVREILSCRERLSFLPSRLIGRQQSFSRAAVYRVASSGQSCRVCTRCRLTSRRSQPPLALAVPLSRFTPRVGGGSALFVRPHMTPKILQDFYDGKRSAALPFVVNDEAIILRGVYAGKPGAVVSIDISEASPRFLIEFGDGTEELVSLDNLEKYDDHVA